MKKRVQAITLSQEAIELLRQHDLEPSDLKTSELAEVENEMRMRRDGILYLDGVEWGLLPMVRLRKEERASLDRTSSTSSE